MVSSFHAAASDSVDSHHAEDAAPAVRHVVFAVAPELVLLDACGPLEAFWRAELAVAARSALPAGGRTAARGVPAAYRTTVASIDGGVLQTFPGLPVVTS